MPAPGGSWIMRLLVVGHSYMTAFAQRKYVAMKRADPELELRIVTPSAMDHMFMRYQHQRHPALLPEETAAIGGVGGRWHMTYVLEPLPVFAIVRGVGTG